MKDLAAAAATYDFVAEHTNDVVIRVDANGVLQYASPSVRDYGYEPEELVGLPSEAIVHPDDLERVWANTLAALRGESLPAYAERQNRYRTAAGDWVWMEGNPKAVLNAAGEIVGMVNVLRDVTERRVQADLFEASFEYAAIGKALVGLDGSFLRVNPALCQITGYAEPALRALDFQSITHAEDLDADLELLRRLAKGEIDSYRMDKRYIRATGEVIWVGLAVSMVHRPDGSPRHYVAQVQDQSARREAEAALVGSETRYRLIAENTSDFIVMTDLEGRTTFISPSVRRTGREPGDLMGRLFSDHVHPKDAGDLTRAFGRLLEGGASEQVRWRGRHGVTGEWIWLESRPNLLRDPLTGQPTGFLDVVRDVTLQVAQEKALAAARVDAEAAAAVKSQFLANMSHEIRTPLTAVLGFTSLLKDLEGLGEIAERYIGKIAGAGNGLLAIVNDILDFSKLEAGKVEIRPRPTDVKAVCAETLEMFAGQAEAKGLTLAFEAEGDLPAMALMDGDRVRQTLINLIGNGIKFTDRGSIILRLMPAEEDAVAIEVSDTGPGLDDEARALLFQRFTQIDGSMTRRHGGTGLGLAICRGLAEAMGGTIGVESQPGQGSTFRLVLPAPPAEAALDDQGAATSLSIEGTRVFVVDDNPANRELARRVLEAAGAEVSEACDGAEGIERLALLPVDVVLMDLRMPVMDGRAALAALRQRPGPNRDVPVLAFTADADLAGEGDLAGFDGLVRKPIQPLEMYAAIAAAADGMTPQDARDAGVAA